VFVCTMVSADKVTWRHKSEYDNLSLVINCYQMEYSYMQLFLKIHDNSTLQFLSLGFSVVPTVLYSKHSKTFHQLDLPVKQCFEESDLLATR